MPKIDIHSLPKGSDLPDIVNIVTMLPDISHIYTTKPLLKMYDYLKLEGRMDKMFFMIAAFSTITLWFVMLMRWFPRLISVPAMSILATVSVMNNCGALLVLYLIFDWGRWLFFGAKRLDIMAIPQHESKRDPWWTKDLSGLTLLLVVLSIGGYMTGAFSTEVMYVCYIVVVVLTFATVFPTNGQNASLNGLLIVLITTILMFVVTGAGERLFEVFSDYMKRSAEQRKERVVVQPVETDAWSELLLALGDWQNTLFFSTFSISLNDPLACLRYIVGAAYLVSLAIGNLCGPTSCIQAATCLQFRLTDKSKSVNSVNSIFMSRWNAAIITSVVATAVRGTWFLTILNVIGVTIAYFWFEYYERKSWAGLGEFASVKSGREDTDMVKGEGPWKLRVFVLKVIIAIITVSHPNLHPVIWLIIGFILFQIDDHRAYCLIAAILTQNYAFLAGVFSDSPTVLYDEIRNKSAPAWAGGEVSTGRNSGGPKFMSILNSFLMNYLPKDSEYWDQHNEDAEVVKNDDKPP